MDLTELKVNEFTELLASDKPAPGGGAAAALAGALGCSLIEMVVSLTKGRVKYAEFEPLMTEISREAAILHKRFLEAVNRDADAYGLVIEAYKLGKDTPDEREERAKAIETALKKASDAPFELMELASKAMLLCEKAVGKSNKNAASDLCSAAVILGASARCARMNILENLNSIKDEGYVRERAEKSAQILDGVLKAAGNIEESRQ